MRQRNKTSNLFSIQVPKKNWFSFTMEILECHTHYSRSQNANHNRQWNGIDRRNNNTLMRAGNIQIRGRRIKPHHESSCPLFLLCISYHMKITKSPWEVWILDVYLALSTNQCHVFQGLTPMKVLCILKAKLKIYIIWL